MCPRCRRSQQSTLQGLEEDLISRPKLCITTSSLLQAITGLCARGLHDGISLQEKEFKSGEKVSSASQQVVCHSSSYTIM